MKEVGEIWLTGGRSCTGSGCYWKEDMCEGRFGSRCGAAYEPKEATETGGLRTEPGPNSL